MAYTPLGLKDGEKVYASHVTHVEDGIADCESQITEVKDSLTELSTALVYKGEYDSDVEGLDSYRTAATSGIYYINGLDVFGVDHNLYGPLIVIGWSTVRVQIFIASSSAYTISLRYFANSAWYNWRSITSTIIS